MAVLRACPAWLAANMGGRRGRLYMPSSSSMPAHSGQRLMEKGGQPGIRLVLQGAADVGGRHGRLLCAYQQLNACAESTGVEPAICKGLQTSEQALCYGQYAYA